MKIATVLNNYRSLSESSVLSGCTSENPEWVFLPDSAMMRSGNPFFIPDLEDLFQDAVSDACFAFPSVALKNGRLGKTIEPRFGSRYLTQGALCVNFIAADILNRRSLAGSPWTEAMAFDRSFVCTEFIPFDSSLTPSLKIDCVLTRADGSDESMVWEGAEMILSPEEVLGRISRMNTMKIGDILIPAIPPLGLKVSRGDTLSMCCDPFPPLSVTIK